MKAIAYLLRSGTVDVTQDGDQPSEYLASMMIDGGVTEDWPFLVRMAQKRMLDTYLVAGGKAVKIEPHCGDKTFKLDKKRFNVNGEPHVCRHRRKKG